MHLIICIRKQPRRSREIASNKKTNIIAHKFNIGDFVVVRRAQDKGHKLSYRWTGPRRITKIIGELVYETENMVNGKLETVHAARILPYRSNIDGTEVSESLMAHIEASEAKYEIVDELLSIEKSEGIFYIHTKWLGLPDKKDWTYQKLSKLYEVLPRAELPQTIMLCFKCTVHFEDIIRGETLFYMLLRLL